MGKDTVRVKCFQQEKQCNDPDQGSNPVLRGKGYACKSHTPESAIIWYSCNCQIIDFSL